ncbi:MAG: hypothetical protein ABUL58_00210 [Steroidobacter sp.]
MTDHVIIPLGVMGVLELPRDVFERHLVKSAPAVTSIEPAALVDAQQLEQRTGIPASWWMTQARERRVPSKKIGRYVRFDVAQVLACDAYQRHAITCTGLPIQRELASG